MRLFLWCLTCTVGGTVIQAMAKVHDPHMYAFGFVWVAVLTVMGVWFVTGWVARKLKG